MSLAPILTAYRRGSEIRIDLGAEADLHCEKLRKWRKEIAALVPASVVRFVAGRTQVGCRGGREFTIKARPERMDDCWQSAEEFYSPDGLSQLIARENKRAMEALVSQLRSPVGVVPFVGAGLSVNFGIPSWPAFLKEAAEFHDAPEQVSALVKESRLIEAATLLAKDADRFQAMVAASFACPIPLREAAKHAVSRLPLLSSGPVITTNFDSVLETAFRVAGAPFDRVITGTEPDNVIRVMQRNEHALIKIHGDGADRSARVFTGLEYDTQYKGISRLARVMFTNRPLLFLGCSLDKDRTLEVLEAIHTEIPGLAHYGVLSGSYSVSRTRARREELARYGITPLWFLPNDFGRIEEILSELIREASTRLVWRASVPAGRARPPRPRKLRAYAFPKTRELPEETAALLSQWARRIVQGRLALFLGAAVHLDQKWSANSFYRSLGEEYGFDEQGVRRADVAQYMIDLAGKQAAWATAKGLLQAQEVVPSLVYHFVAELPDLLRRAGKIKESRLWILTTNYDAMLEDVLTRRGESFHLLYYHVDGPDAGRFVHRDPHGTLRVVERPNNVSSLVPSAHVAIKLDGGVAWDPHIAETVTIAPMDSIIAAANLPVALPEVVRRALQQRSMLVLGSSLRDAHVQRFVRWVSGSRRLVRTWAVAKDLDPESIRFWRAAGVVLIDCDLAILIPALREKVIELLK